MSLTDLRYRMADELELIDAIKEMHGILAIASAEAETMIVVLAIAEKQKKIGDGLMLAQAADMATECSETVESECAKLPRLLKLARGLIAAIDRKSHSEFPSHQAERMSAAIALIESHKRGVTEAAKLVNNLAKGGGIIMPQ